MGSLIQEPVLHQLVQPEFFPQAAVLQQLPMVKKLLQEWPCSSLGPTGSQVQAENVFQLLFPQVLPGAAPGQTSYRVTASFGHPPAPVLGPPWAAGGSLLPQGPPWAASPWAAGEFQCLAHLLPALPHCPQCCRAVALIYITPLCDCCYAGFLPFPKYVIPEVLPPFLRISTSSAGIVCMRQEWSFSSFSYKPPAT